MDFNLPWVVLIPFIGAAFAALSSRLHSQASTYVSIAFTLLALAFLAPQLGVVFAGERVVQAWDWIPQLGLSWAFRLDGLALLFALLILVMGILVIIYARYYLSARDSMGRFFAYLMMFMGSMLGIVLSENLIQLVIFWELTSLSSFLLISYWQHIREARNGARMALAVTGAGGLALLAGVLILGKIVGSYNLTDVLASGDLIRNHELYSWALGFILLGVFTKSAQFPFHFWLPNAMAAPTPVSAYLHSATMVKAGIFLLARLFPALSGTPEWMILVGGAGVITFVWGAYNALFKHDLKGLLAYSTISHLGLIVLLLGFSTELALVAALFHIINHATFKASLFMVAGIIDHEAGGRDMRRLGALFKFMPFTAILAMIAAAAMAGVPLLNGFLSKEMFFEQVWSAGHSSLIDWLLLGVVISASVFAVAYSLRFIHDVFFGEEVELQKDPQEPPLIMTIPVGILVVACLAVGMLPSLTVAPLLDVALAGALVGEVPEYSLALWHGFNFPLFMSFIALVAGVLIYFNRAGIFAWHDRVFENLDARIFYDWILEGFYNWAEKITRFFDRGSLQNAIGWVVGVSLVAGFYGFFITDTPLQGSKEMLPIDPFSWVVVTSLVIASILAGVLHRQRYIAIVIMGIVGLIIALGFVKFSAPDLALTQISIEMVTVVLLLLALYFLPQTTPKEVVISRYARDLILAVFAGVGVAALSFAVMTREFSSVSGFFVENAVSGGGGTNVVNVILVDFRGFDTLGEVVVLALAGLGIFAMLEGMKLYAPQKDMHGRLWDTDMQPLILMTFSRLLFPLMLIVAAFIFMRGHNLPGGGFIAGLIVSVALIVQYLANGIDWTKQRVWIDMHWATGLGLMVATFTGLAAVFLGYPFLTSTFGHFDLPYLGEVELASAIAFDLGILMAVVGAMVMTLVQLGKLTHASHKE